MAQSPQGSEGVNSPAGVSSLTLARWQGALGIVLGRYAFSGLLVTDARALDAYAALEAGHWLEAVLWLSEGPAVDEAAALCDPLGSLLAAIVLHTAAPLVHVAQPGRASPFWRAVAIAYYQALQRRPVRDPLMWATESLLRSGGTRSDLLDIERTIGERFTERRLSELMHKHLRDWEAEALERLLGYRRE